MKRSGAVSLGIKAAGDPASHMHYALVGANFACQHKLLEWISARPKAVGSVGKSGTPACGSGENRGFT